MFAMRQFHQVLIFTALLASGWLPLRPAGQEQTPEVAILSPQPGQALQGTVAISAQTSLRDLRRAELSFTYHGDTSGAWFLIWEEEGRQFGKTTLAEWDTTTLTDGDYTLRLLLTRQDGSQAEARVENLRVRNYTPIETETPSPAPTGGVLPAVAATSTPLPGPTATLARPSLTPLPTNPAQLSPQQVGASLARGATWALAGFAALGLYALLRSLLASRR
jgi:hypothetical protein